MSYSVPSMLRVRIALDVRLSSLPAVPPEATRIEVAGATEVELGGKPSRRRTLNELR
jgi:hypothetical protein